jgi:hypothetical protein
MQLDVSVQTKQCIGDVCEGICYESKQTNELTILENIIQNYLSVRNN